MKSKSSTKSSEHSKPKTAIVRKSNKENGKKHDKEIVEKSKPISTLGQACFLIGGSITFIILTAIFVIIMTACTYSINMVDTHGKAADVVDETETIDPKIDPTLNLPGAI